MIRQLWEFFKALGPRTLAGSAASLMLAAASGFLTASALGKGSHHHPVETTVTVTISAGSAILICPKGFSPGELVINHPGGQTVTWTCIHG